MKTIEWIQNERAGKGRQASLIGLLGVQRSGKDELSGTLGALGWQHLAFGDQLKSFFAPYIAGQQGRQALLERIRMEGADGPQAARTPALERLEESLRALSPWLEQIEARIDEEGGMDAFSEDDHQKAVFRPLLEHGGDLINPWATRHYFEEIDRVLSQGGRVINPRVGRVHEIEMLHARGGLCIQVLRRGFGPGSAWEAQAIGEVSSRDLIDAVARNHAGLEEWHQACLALAREIGGDRVSS